MATYPSKQDIASAPETNSKKPAPPVIQGPVTGIPVSGITNQHQHARWSTGLCDCFSDVPNCCITCWCPCITFGQIAEIADKGTTSCAVGGAIYGILMWFTGCPCLYSCLYRTKMRKQFMLEDQPCNDCLVHFCCDACALCQEYRELKHRGFDMALGWEGNMERQKGGVAMAAPIAPAVEQGMNR